MRLETDRAVRDFRSMERDLARARTVPIDLDTSGLQAQVQRALDAVNKDDDDG